MLLLHNQGNDLWARCAASEFKHVGTRTGPVCAMKTKNRVIWSEGLFLRPQHFQQSERFIEQWIDLRLRALARFAHGFTELELDREQLRMGKVALRNAEGVMPDGTPFSIPDDHPPPPPVDIPADFRERRIFLALPLRRHGSAEFAIDSETQSQLVRYIPANTQIRDSVADLATDTDMLVGELNLRLVLEGDPLPTHSLLGVARVVERLASGRIELADDYIPPVLHVQVHQKLADFLAEVSSMLRHRANALAERMGMPGQKGAGEVTDFLMLQVLNRFDPCLQHLKRCAPLHPEDVYRAFIQLAGELATFTRDGRRSAEFAAYDQDALFETFRPVIDEIRQSLSTVLDQPALQIPLESRGSNIFTGTIPDKELVRSGTFVLAVFASIPDDSLRAQFPAHIKIASTDKLRNLVLSHLPGIGLRSMQVLPPRIPYHSGFTYFELDRSNELWRELEVSPVLALYVAGEFPGLQLELWALRA